MASKHSPLELEVLDLHVVRPGSASGDSESEQEEVIFSTRALLSKQLAPHAPSLRKELSLFNGVMIVVGAIIGSGIFFTPQIVLKHAGSFGVSMITWAVGAIIALAGALCFVELGLLVRSSGGDYSFLLEGYSFNRRSKCTTMLGECVAFLFIWCTVFIMRPGGLAVISLTCAHYLAQPFFMDCSAPESVVKLLALSIVSEYL